MNILTGSPPTCEQCPQCFDDWLSLIAAEETAVQRVGGRVDTLLSGYLPLTLSNITTQINQLNAQLLEAANLAQNSSLNRTQLSQLEVVLSLLSRNLTSLEQLMSEINSSLLVSEANTQASARFNGTIQLESGELINAAILLAELTAEWVRIDRARETAREALRSIDGEYIKISLAQAIIDNTRERVAVYTNTSENIADQLAAINSTVASFNGKFNKNREVLSSLEQIGEEVGRQQIRSRSQTAEGSSLAGGTGNVTREAARLAREKEGRAADSLHSIGVLLNDTNSTASQSDSALSASLAVLETSIESADLANKTQYAQTELLAQLDSLEQSGSLTEQLSRESLSLIGPYPASAGLLSASINRLIVPEAVVESIRTEANRSLAQARVANEIAVRAQLAANNASNLLIQVVSNIDLTQVTQTVTTNVSIENARNALGSAGEAIGEFYRETDQLIETSDRIIYLQLDVEQINREVNNKFEEGFQSATVAEGECIGACGRAVSLDSLVQVYIDGIQELPKFLTQKEAFVSEAVRRLTALVNTTNGLLETVASVDLEEINTLLQDLAAEEQEIEDMQREGKQLERDIALVEESISELVQLYQSCPQ